MLAAPLPFTAHIDTFEEHCDWDQHDAHVVSRLRYRSLRRRSAKMLRRARRSGPWETIRDPGAADYLASRGHGRIVVPHEPGAVPMFALHRHIREAMSYCIAA